MIMVGTGQSRTGIELNFHIARLFSCSSWNIGGTIAVTFTARLTGVLAIFSTENTAAGGLPVISCGIELVLAPPVNGGRFVGFVNGGFDGFHIRIFIKPNCGWGFVGRGFWLPEGTERPSLSGNGSVRSGSSSSSV